MLARALRALGVPAERVPLTDGEAAAVLRSRLVGRRVLLGPNHTPAHAADVAAVASKIDGALTG